MTSDIEALLVRDLLLDRLLVIVINAGMRVNGACHSVRVVLSLHDVRILIYTFILHLLIFLNRWKLTQQPLVICNRQIRLTLKESSSLESVLF